MKLAVAAAILAIVCTFPAMAADPERGAPAQALSPAGHELTTGDLETWLDGFMPYALSRGGIPGAQVVVVRDGQVLLEKGYGVSDVAAGKPVDPRHTLFRVGSVSKIFTWIAVMQQVEAKKIDLDADVNTYLDFKVPTWRG